MKKAILSLTSGLVPLILSVIVILAAVVVVRTIFDDVDSVTEESGCKTSVMINARARISADPELPSAPGPFTIFDPLVHRFAKQLLAGQVWIETIDCPTLHKTIEHETLNTEIEKDKIREQLAKRQLACWDNFGRGTLELFEGQTDGEITYCIVCEIIEFDGPEGKVDGYLKYISTHNPPGSEETYFKIFTRSDTLEAVHSRDSPSEDPTTFAEESAGLFGFTEDATEMIDTSDNYAVVFVYSKEIRNFALSRATVAGSAAAGAVTGAALLSWTGPGAIVGAGAGAIIGLLYGPTVNAEWEPSPVLVPLDSNLYNELKCQQLPSRQGSDTE